MIIGLDWTDQTEQWTKFSLAPILPLTYRDAVEFERMRILEEDDDGGGYSD